MDDIHCASNPTCSGTCRPTAIFIAAHGIDGEMRAGELAGLPLYDRKAEIPRGKLMRIPHRPE